MKLQSVMEQRQEEEVGLQEEAGLQEGCRGKAAHAAQPRGRDWDGVGGSNQGHQEHHHGQVLDMEEKSKIYDRKYTVVPCLLFLQLNELYP